MDIQDVDGEERFNHQPDQCGGATDKGPRRTENQDAFWITDPDTPTELGALYMVADGVGGQQDGAIASKLAVETVEKEFYALRRQSEPLSLALKRALEKANQLILEEAQIRQVRKMGSTFVAAVLYEGELTVAHVGDARAYLIRQGKMRQLTRDDTWVQRQVEAGLITEEEAARHEFRNVVTQVLGNKPAINVNLSSNHTLQAEDAILLCSDGLYDVLPESRMISVIAENDPESAARLLVDAAIEGEATDNITAVVIRPGEAAPLADEPTLAAAPVPIESAPTIMAPVPAPAPAAAGKDGDTPRWLFVLAIVAVLIIVGALFAFWVRNRAVTEDSLEAAATTLPEIAETSEEFGADALRSLEATATIEPPAATEEPTISPTPELPDTPTPRPTATNQAVSENRGCVNDGINPFIWEETQITSGICDSTQVGLVPGDEVEILDEQPLFGEGLCGSVNFIKIQAVAETTKIGWIREELVDPLSPGESCSP